ncbi:MAG: hypothetical protein LBJ41_03510 [Treponema sp.]|jgi:hypothetical protein|nr:hypothetical protein [Treponema sp.]
MSTDIFSPGEAEFLILATAFNASAIAHADLLGIPAALVTDNTAKFAAYTAAYHIAGTPNAGRIDRRDRNEKRIALTHNMRKIKKAYLDANPLDTVTSEILLGFGLHPKDNRRTEVGVPTEVVPFSLEHGGYLQIIVKHPARPKGYNGAVAHYKVGEPVPTSHKELTNSRLLTRIREVFTFDGTDLGKTLYIVLYWQNEKGRMGPPSPIQSQVIA